MPVKHKSQSPCRTNSRRRNRRCLTSGKARTRRASPSRRYRSSDLFKEYSAQDVQEWIKNGVYVNRYHEGWTMLMYAAKYGHVEVLRVLLDANADVEAELRTSAGGTSLHIAAHHGHPDCVEALLLMNAELESKDNQGNTPLILAALAGHTQCVTILLNNGANVNASKDGGWTALMLAAYNGYREVVNVLLDNGGVNVNASGDTALILAAQNGYEEVVKALLDKGGVNVNASKDGWTVLMRSCFKGHHGVVDILLRYNPDVTKTNEEGHTALMMACIHGNHECANKVLTKASETERTFLLTQRTNEKNWTPLMLAVVHKHDECARVLVAAGARRNLVDPEGNTVLMLALKYSQTSLHEINQMILALANTQDFEELMENDFYESDVFNINAFNHEGDNVLTLANYQVIRFYLMHFGADPFTRDVLHGFKSAQQRYPHIFVHISPETLIRADRGLPDAIELE